MAHRGYLANYRRRRWSRFAEYRIWLVQEALAGLSWDHALTLFRSSAARGIKEFRTNQLEEVRDALDFLLYDTITLEIRFAECAGSGGSYHLPGWSKEFVSYLLCLRDPSLFGIWQPYVPRALRLMGKGPPNLGKGHLGLGYLDLLDARGLGKRPDWPIFVRWTDIVTRSPGDISHLSSNGQRFTKVVCPFVERWDNLNTLTDLPGGIYGLAGYATGVAG